MGAWIVQPNAVGGWDVRSWSSPARSFRTSTRAAAEEWVRATAAPGDSVSVVDGRGSVLATFDKPAVSVPRVPSERRPATPAAPPGTAAPATPVLPVRPPAPPPTMSLAQRLEKEGGTWDSWLEWVVPLGLAAGTGFITPAFAELGGSWIAICIGTLTWSLGVAGATYAIVSERLQGWEAASAFAVSLLVASFVAYGIGVGVLALDFTVASGSHPVIRVIATFAFAAVQAYGALGALISGGIGAWLGWRVAQHTSG